MKRIYSIILSLLMLVLLRTSIAFPQTTYSLYITTSIGGTTNPSPGFYSYEEGVNVTITAIPDSMFNFSYWTISKNSVSYNSTENPLTITIDSNIEVIAYFTPITGDVLDALSRVSILEIIILIGSVVGQILGIQGYPLTLGVVTIILVILFAPYLLLFSVRFRRWS